MFIVSVETIYNTPLLDGAKQFPTYIAEDMLSAFGNHEAKALLLIAMEPGRFYSADDLHKLYMNIQGGTTAWKTDRKLQYNYCVYSLDPIGMVAQQQEDPIRDAKGYTVTEFGYDLGRPFAGHLLDFSASLGISLQILGRTNTSGQKEERSPVDSANLIDFLVKSKTPKIRVADVLESMGQSKSNRISITPHLQRLAEAGLITFAAAGESFNVIYERTDTTEAPDLCTLRNQRVGEIVLGHIVDLKPGQSVSLNELEMLLVDNFPGIYRDRRRRRGIAAVALSSLARQGALNQTGDFSHRQRTLIEVSNEQREIMRNFLAVSTKQEADLKTYLKEGQVKADAILNRPSIVRRLLYQARSYSPSINKADEQDSQTICEIVLNSGEIKTSDIGEIFRRTTDRRFTNATIRNILNELEISGKLTSARVGKSSVWMGAPDSS
ncbi:MAG: hypothetical protein NVSMB46_04110 [Candidatus Saccharimonadales bacterium]